MPALLDLQSGRVDAVFLDNPVATTWLAKSGNKNYTTDGSIINVKFFGPGNAIAVNKQDNTLKKAINKALKQLKANGTLKKLQVKWFGAHK